MRQDACDIGEEAAKAHTAPGHVLCVGAGRQPPEVHTTSATHQYDSPKAVYLSALSGDT